MKPTAVPCSHYCSHDYATTQDMLQSTMKYTSKCYRTRYFSILILVPRPRITLQITRCPCQTALNQVIDDVKTALLLITLVVAI